MPVRPKSNLKYDPPKLNNSIDKVPSLNSDPLSGAGGRALLHDLDTKF